VDLQELLEGAGRSVVFGVIGIGLMAVGFVLVDLLTPGKLRDLIWVERNPNAALLLVANQLGIAAIVFTAIFTSYANFVQGIASTLIFVERNPNAGLLLSANQLGIAAIVFTALEKNN